MAFAITRESIGEIGVLHCKGRITLGLGSCQLRAEAKAIATEGVRKLILDLGEVTYVDSSGYGELVSAYTIIKNQRGNLVFARPSRRLLGEFKIRRLDEVFEIFSELESAISYFNV